MTTTVHSISVVVPVYRGETTLPNLIEELVLLRGSALSPAGSTFSIEEILLVHDNGPDRSDVAMRQLEEAHDNVRTIWLARNYGQHAATLAGIASSGSQWVVTMDEDGQHVPKDIGLLLDTALAERTAVVYGRHSDGAPHAKWRNATSTAAKSVVHGLAGVDVSGFSSFRLIDGERARSVAAYCGPRTYFDIALTWAADRTSTCVVTTRAEQRSGSGYSFSALMSHFWTLVLSSGTRPLRLVSAMGLSVAVLGILFAALIIIGRFTTELDVPGWASVMVALLTTNGLILFTLGVLAEYVGALLQPVQGKPLYIVVADPNDGPLGPSK